jgi:hypothetical protein
LLAMQRREEGDGGVVGRRRERERERKRERGEGTERREGEKETVCGKRCLASIFAKSAILLPGWASFARGPLSHARGNGGKIYNNNGLTASERAKDRRKTKPQRARGSKISSRRRPSTRHKLQCPKAQVEKEADDEGNLHPATRARDEAEDGSGQIALPRSRPRALRHDENEGKRKELTRRQHSYPSLPSYQARGKNAEGVHPRRTRE